MVKVGDFLAAQMSLSLPECQPFEGDVHGVGKRKRTSQGQLWVATQHLRAPGHPFYKRLSEVLAKHGFDEFVEERCATFYAEGIGRSAFPPGCISACS